MIPIFEQGTGEGIGYTFDTFRARFDTICDQHLEQGRAQAFAFVFYDFGNSELRHLLGNRGVFAKLDRLSGNKLSVFYLHAGSREVTEKFNYEFMNALGVVDQVSLPCVVFFRVTTDQIEDIEIAQLDSANLIHGFHELYSIIEDYLATGLTKNDQHSRVLRWTTVAVKFVSVEFFKMILKKTFESYF